MSGRPKMRGRKEAIARGEARAGQSRPSIKTEKKARPLTLDIVERILTLCGTLASGDASNAAALSGVPNGDFRAWLAIGSQNIDDDNRDTPHALLVQGMQEIAARKVEDRVAIIEGGTQEQITITTKYRETPDGELIEERSEQRAPGDWKAAAWLLERTSPRYQQRVRIDVEKELNAMLALLERKLPPEIFAMVCGIVAESEVSS